MKKWLGWFAGSGRAEPVALPVDLTAPRFFEDPGPAWGWLRGHAPVAEVAGGGVLLTRHADVLAALSDRALGNAPSRFSVLHARNADRYTAADLARNIPPFLDKPEHVPLRQALSRAFRHSFAEAQGWVPRLARARVAEQTGEVPLIAGLARPFACETMARFVGLPVDPSAIKSASDAFFHLFAPARDAETFARVNAALAEARVWIAAAVPKAPTGSLIAGLRDEGLGSDQIADNAYLVLADGIENIEAGIAMGWDIARDQGFAASDDWPAIAEELLRLASPAQVVPRVAREATTLVGRDIAPGTPVFLALGSANLDEAAHPDPLALRPGRDQPVLVLGRGRHACIGAPLARLMIGSMVGALCARGARRVDAGPLLWHRRFGHRWPQEMQIRL